MWKEKGFTLVELLVVIAVVALLLSMLMPTLNAARQRAYMVVCSSDERQLMMAWFLYADNNDGLIAESYTADYSDYPWVKAPLDAAGNLVLGVRQATVEEKIRGIKEGMLYPYLEDIKVYRCPADKRLKRPDNAYRSYSISHPMNGYTTYMKENGMPIMDQEYSVTNVTQIRIPAEKYVFVEENDPRGWNMGSWVLFYNSVSRYHWWDPIAVWHYDSSVLGYADGHVVSHRWSDSIVFKLAAAEIS